MSRSASEAARRPWWHGIAAGLSGLALFLFVPYAFLDAAVGGPLSQWWAARPFEADDWQDPKLWRTGARQHMVDDLLSRHRLVGWSRARVEALLGAPEPPGTAHGADEMVYYLGPEQGLMGIDSELLVLYLGSDGAVERISFHSD